MKPETSRTNREQLFFAYAIDCQTPRKPGGGPDQTRQALGDIMTEFPLQPAPVAGYPISREENASGEGG